MPQPARRPYEKPAVLWRGRAGNFAPIPVDTFMPFLARKRGPFTDLEALLSVALAMRRNLFNGAQRVTPSPTSCRKRWGWGHERVSRFLRDNTPALLGFYASQTVAQERHPLAALQTAPLEGPQDGALNQTPAPQTAPPDETHLSKAKEYQRGVSEAGQAALPALLALIAEERRARLGAGFTKSELGQVTAYLQEWLGQAGEDEVRAAVSRIFADPSPPRRVAYLPDRFQRHLAELRREAASLQHARVGRSRFHPGHPAFVSTAPPTTTFEDPRQGPYIFGAGRMAPELEVEDPEQDTEPDPEPEPEPELTEAEREALAGDLHRVARKWRGRLASTQNPHSNPSPAGEARGTGDSER